jgi:hypothetical protein
VLIVAAGGSLGKQSKRKNIKFLGKFVGQMLLWEYSSALSMSSFLWFNGRCAVLHQKVLPESISKGTIFKI